MIILALLLDDQLVLKVAARTGSHANPGAHPQIPNLVIPRGLSPEESAVVRLAKSRFLNTALVRNDNAESLPAKRKKRPELFSSGRLGSPPPELPNHAWILFERGGSVNVTLVIRARLPVIAQSISEVIANGAWPTLIPCVVGTNCVTRRITLRVQHLCLFLSFRGA